MNLPLSASVALFTGLGTTAVVIPATNPDLEYIGRFTTESNAKLFDMPGCEIRANFNLTAPAVLTAVMSQRHLPSPPHAQGNSKNSGFQENSFVVWVDGKRQCEGRFNATFATSASQQDNVPYEFNLTLGGAPLQPGVHSIRMMKNTEADWNGGDPVPNYMNFTGFKATPASTDNNLRVTTVPTRPRSIRRIEFLGDSITAGYCNECQYGPSSTRDHTEAFDCSWASYCTELLGAEMHVTAWSGLGLVRNCCGGNTTLPTIFNRTLATVNDDSDNLWDFSEFKPQALVINVGTNDGSAVDDPRYHYRQSYTDLVMEAAASYGPDLHVFLACGPMSNRYCQAVHDVISNVTAKGVQASFLDQTPFLNGTFGKACCGHPSVEVDTAMAQHCAHVVGSTVGWEWSVTP